ncbi:MAG: hypothetical protein JW966_01245 [Anaerolineae bacterium]|nr:hypothetical protein [Anaerolineae bacterium]
MNGSPRFERTDEFLREQISLVDHKTTRLKGARESCRNELEANSLDSMIQNAHLERDILTELLSQQVADDALSLDAIVSLTLTRCQRQSERLAAGWHRGRPTPAAYWEIENRRAFLTRLLRAFHAWRVGRPYYPVIRVETLPETELNESHPHQAPSNAHPVVPGSGSQHAYPWYIGVPIMREGEADENHEADNGDSISQLDALRNTILDAVHDTVFPEDHLEIIVQPNGYIIVTGYAHNDDEQQIALDTIMTVEGVEEALIDIHIVLPNKCPICHPESEAPKERRRRHRR